MRRPGPAVSSREQIGELEPVVLVDDRQVRFPGPIAVEHKQDEDDPAESGFGERASAISAPDRTRRDAIARNLCARICDERRTVRELLRVDREMMAVERERHAERFTIYIAGAAAEIDRVEHVIEAARQLGLDVICTWPGIVRKTPGGSNPRDASVEQREGWSSQDIREVAEADCFWFLVPQAQTRGAWVEAGFAIANGKHVVFSGDTKQSIFCALGEEFEDDHTALRYIARIARDRADARRMLRGLRELRDAGPTPTPPLRVPLDDRFDDGGQG